MPARDEHLAKAKANASFLESVVSGHLAPDWAVVVQFYRAMHIVEAHFAQQDIRHLSHVQRNRAVFDELGAIAGAHSKLYDVPRLARYGSDGLIAWSDHDESIVAYQEIAAHLVG